MLKKALKKLTKITSRRREKTSPEKPPTHTRLLTAEGWRRLMMKKHHKG
jgi:hypothetical protein